MPGRTRSILGALCLLAFTASCSAAPGQELGELTREQTVPPATGLGGLIGNNAGGLVPGEAEGFVGNNAGGLTGTVLGPAAELIGNNAAGIGVVGNNGGNFTVMAAGARFAPASGASVVAVDASGRQVSEGAVTTDAEGRYRFERLRPSGPVVFVVATYALAGRTLTLMGAAPAPREAAGAQVPVDPATSLVAKKVATLLGRQALAPRAVSSEGLAELAVEVSEAMTDRAIAEAVLLTGEAAAAAFDRVAADHPGVEDALAQLEAGPAPDGLSDGAPAARTVDTLAGSGAAGWKDGAGAEAQLHYPYGIAADGRGSLYVADYQNHRIRKLTPDGQLTTLAGTGEAGFRDGPAAQALFANPRGLAVDAEGGVIVVDTGNVRVRRIAPDGTVTTLAGTGEAGFADGAGAGARFADPRGVAVGPDGRIYVADTGNFRIRVLSPEGQVSTLAVVGDGEPVAAESKLKGPYGVAVDGQGRVYVADATTNAIETISPDGVVSRFGGTGAWGLADGGADAARFRAPVGLSVDGRGNLYVADFFNHSIRMLSADGRVTTLAGDGQPGATNGDGPGARFYGPYGLAVGADHKLYVADTSNHRIRAIALP